MKGININCKRKDWIALILTGEKTVETRDSKSLDPYIGKRIGLVMTGRGKATLCGYATIKERIEYHSYNEWHNDGRRHLVNNLDKYRWKMNETKIKYGYVLEDIESCEHRFVTSRGIVAREI